MKVCDLDLSATYHSSSGYIYVDPYEAMNSLGAKVTMEVTKIGVQGYPGIGKTSILDLAMGKEPALVRNSTGCVDPPSHYMLIDNEDSMEFEWENVTTDKMFELLCGAVKKTIVEDPSDNIPSISSLPSESNTVNAVPVAIDQLPVNFTSQDQTPHCEPEPEYHSDSSPIYWFSNLLKDLHSSESSGIIFNSHWLMVTDSGGQPPFLDAAALFLQNSCFQIFPLKLNEPLSKVPEFSYFFDGMSANCDKFGICLSNQQSMETLVKSIGSIQPPYTPSVAAVSKCPKGAKFTIVGTFEDESHNISETIEDKESILQNALESYEPFQVLHEDDKIILPINAITTNNETRKSLSKQLRRLIKSADVTMKVEVKLRWFGFLLSILTLAEKEHKAILTLYECYKLGDSLEMDNRETDEAIKFFHDISLIMHFDTPKLRYSVIINTKVVLEKVSRLITVSFLDKTFLAKHYNIFLATEEKLLLQNHGRFTEETLHKCIEFSEPITPQFFLDILEFVKIVAVIVETSEYFMPCALPVYPDHKWSDFSVVWVVRLKARKGVSEDYVPIPVGYLPALVVFLLTEFSSHYSLTTDPHRRRHSSHRQYRNVITMKYKLGGTVRLVERHLQLEVHYSVSICEKLATERSAIRKHFLESMRLTEEKLHIREGAFTKVDSFLCSCEKVNGHLCDYNPESGILECDENGEVTTELKPQHLLWLGMLL